jgi:ubiquinone/menaquinone biosynthesis C-methylase UbiE
MALDPIAAAYRVMMKSPLRPTIEANLAYPRGLWGAYTAAVMNRVNAGITAFTLEQLQPKPGNEILEIGFGGGVSFKLLLPLIEGGHLHGLDASPDMLKLAGRRAAADVAAGRLLLRQGDVQKLPYADASMDGAFAVNTLYFFPNPPGCVKELWRVLKPGGRLALGIRSKAVMQKMGFVRAPFRSFSEADMKELLSGAGFSRYEVVSRDLSGIETQVALGVK